MTAFERMNLLRTMFFIVVTCVHVPGIPDAIFYLVIQLIYKYSHQLTIYGILIQYHLRISNWISTHFGTMWSHYWFGLSLLILCQDTSKGEIMEFINTSSYIKTGGLTISPSHFSCRWNHHWHLQSKWFAKFCQSCPLNIIRLVPSSGILTEVSNL